METKEELLKRICRDEVNTSCKDCISSIDCKESFNCINCKASTYSYYCTDCSHCLKAINCTKCFSSYYCISCYNCSFCDNCVNCRNCSDCIGCSNIENGKYMINNHQFTKEEYFKIARTIDIVSDKNNKNWEAYVKARKDKNHSEALEELNFSFAETTDKTKVEKLQFKLYEISVVAIVSLITIAVVFLAVHPY